MKKYLRSPWLKKIVALCVLVLLLYLVDPRQLWDALRQLTWGAVLYLGLLSVLLIYISSLKWKFFLETLGAPVSVFRLFNLYLVGYFVNLAMPSYVGGDLVRSWYIGRKVGQHKALTATILERYTGLAAMVGLGAVFVWFVDLVTPEIKTAVLAIAVALVFVTILALSPRLLVFAGQWRILEPFVKHARKIQDGFHVARQDRRVLVKAMLLSLLYHSVTVVNTVAAGHAVGWFTPPVWDLFVVLPLILLLGALPLTPSGLGIQEGAFYFFLTGIGATPAQALGIGVVLRAKQYILALVGGVVWLCDREDAGLIQRELEGV